MEDNFSIRNWKHKTVYKEEYEGSLKEGMPSQEEVTNFLEKFGQELHYLYDKPVSSWDEYDLSNWKAKKNRLQKEDKNTNHIVKYSSTNDTFQVWKGDEIITDFATKERAEAEAKRLNNLDSIKRIDRLQEEDELEDDEIEVEIPSDEDNAPAGDKALNAKLSKQDAIIKQYKDLSNMMQRNLKNYKEAADENAKKMAMLALKELTPKFQEAKKAYEKLKGIKL